jgi:hypothetical protein
MNSAFVCQSRRRRTESKEEEEEEEEEMSESCAPEYQRDQHAELLDGNKHLKQDVDRPHLHVAAHHPDASS